MIMVAKAAIVKIMLLFADPMVRLEKERLMCVKELEIEHKRLQTMKDEGRDEHELRQQVCALIFEPYPSETVFY
jgi:hypothetical protein